MEYCKTCDNLADIFTKPLGRVKFEVFIGMLGVQDNPFSIKGGVKNNQYYFVLMEKWLHSCNVSP